MPFRDDAEALRLRVDALEDERRQLRAALERAHAFQRSMVAQLAGRAFDASTSDASVDWRSLPDGDPIEVIFVNRSGRQVTLSWFGFDGRLHEEATLVPDGRRRVESHTGALWRASAGAEVYLQRYLTAGDREIEISPARGGG